MRRLKAGSQFVDPRFLRSLPAQGIVRDGIVHIGDKKLYFDESVPYSDGTKVRVTCPRFFQCESLEEIEQRQRKRQLVSNLIDVSGGYYQRIKESQAQRFNESLNIPVDWVPEIKPVLSGLSRGSWGDGRKGNSVNHVLLLEDLEVGRLKREAGQFLCSTDLGKFPELRSRKTYQDKEVKVTCKTCLKRAQKFQN